jgi:translation initiation factor 4E
MADKETEKKDEAAGGAPAAAPSADVSVKHPLQNAWVLWFDNPVKRLGAKDWSQNLKKVGRMMCSRSVGVHSTEA